MWFVLHSRQCDSFQALHLQLPCCCQPPTLMEREVSPLHPSGQTVGLCGLVRPCPPHTNPQTPEVAGAVAWSGRSHAAERSCEAALVRQVSPSGPSLRLSPAPDSHSHLLRTLAPCRVSEGLSPSCLLALILCFCTLAAAFQGASPVHSVPDLVLPS